jgi:hypothetical protein
MSLLGPEPGQWHVPMLGPEPNGRKRGKLTDTARLHRPNEWLISCKRPVTTYGPLPPLGASDANGTRPRPRLSAALAG